MYCFLKRSMLRLKQLPKPWFLTSQAFYRKSSKQRLHAIHKEVDEMTEMMGAILKAQKQRFALQLTVELNKAIIEEIFNESPAFKNVDGIEIEINSIEEIYRCAIGDFKYKMTDTELQRWYNYVNKLYAKDVLILQLHFDGKYFIDKQNKDVHSFVFKALDHFIDRYSGLGLSGIMD